MKVEFSTATAKAAYFLENDGKSIKVTDEQWEQLLDEVDAEYRNYHTGYIERLQDYDYLIENPPIGWRYYRNAIITKGYSWTRTLADMDGNLVDAERVQTKFGWAWKINKPDGVEWVTDSTASTLAKRQAFYNKKGYRLASVLVRVRPTPKHSEGWLEYDFSDIAQTLITDTE